MLKQQGSGEGKCSRGHQCEVGEKLTRSTLNSGRRSAPNKQPTQSRLRCAATHSQDTDVFYISHRQIAFGVAGEVMERSGLWKQIGMNTAVAAINATEGVKSQAAAAGTDAQVAPEVNAAVAISTRSNRRDNGTSCRRSQ